MVTTFILGIVLAVVAGAAGVALTALWMRSREPRGPDPAQPVADAVARLEGQIRGFELERRQMLGGLERHLTSLSRETVALSHALRAPGARGRWGELTLRRVAELAGMVPYCDFQEQASSNGLRPDMVVKLPGGRTLAVDAKAPLAAYLDAEAAAEETARRAALERHAQQLWRHVTHLASREYWSGFEPAPEMVVLFVPGDHLLSVALEHDPDLLDRALARKVLVATPVTLVSVLKGIAYGWKQERLAENADELRRIASEFYDRMRAFAALHAESGRSLGKAVEAYNKSVASWDARLKPSLKRMRELGAGGAADVPDLPGIEQTVPENANAAATALQALEAAPKALEAKTS